MAEETVRIFKKSSRKTIIPNIHDAIKVFFCVLAQRDKKFAKPIVPFDFSNKATKKPNSANATKIQTSSAITLCTIFTRGIKKPCL